MARDFLLIFGSASLSGATAAPVPTFTGSYVTGGGTTIGSVIDLGSIGGQNNRSELFARVNVNVSAVTSTSGDTTTYWTFNPVVEASKDNTNFSVISTLPVDVQAFKVAYATASTISGDGSIQMYVPLYGPAGTISQNSSGAAEDNYRYFRIRLLYRAFGAGSGHTVTATTTAAIVNAKDGGI